MSNKRPRISRFPNNEDRRSFRIRRGVSKETKEGLGFLEGLPSAFSAKKIKLRPEHAQDLTLVSKGYVMEMRKSVPSLRTMLFRDMAKSVLEPALPSAEQRISTRVADIGYIGTRELVNVALFLEDPENQLREEYQTYVDRFDYLGALQRWPRFVPHLSLAQVPKTLASTAVLDWVERRVSEDVMLLPVSTDPRIPEC